VAQATISLDGYGAGPRQDLGNPFGVGGLALHEWMLATRTFRHLVGEEGGTTGVDDNFVKRGIAGIGAWILGRNMFGPVRGPWPDDTWNGWWGDNPPYHTPVFVLTHHTRRPITMEGGTEFRFVNDIRSALKQAVDAGADASARAAALISESIAIAPHLSLPPFPSPALDLSHDDQTARRRSERSDVDLRERLSVMVR
jgi:dihydrofolate reductase